MATGLMSLAVFAPWFETVGPGAFSISFESFGGSIQRTRYTGASFGISLLVIALVAVVLVLTRRWVWILRSLGALTVVSTSWLLYLISDEVGSGGRAFWAATGAGPLLAIAAGLGVLATARR